MTSNPRRTPLIEALDVDLEKTLGLRRVATLSDLLAPDSNGRFWREPRLTIASHFDLEPAFLVFDPLLGTLGVVDVVLREIGDENAVEAQVNRAIDRASYLRHLLVRDKARGDARPLTVELVLLTADETEEEKSCVAAIGEAVRAVLRGEDSLYHTGFGILQYAGQTASFGGRLRRAFPWLLTATRKWLESVHAQPAEAANGTPRSLKRLTLNNYRLSTERTLSFAPARVHLLHGANGSGKSAIAEALELITTGKVERIDLAAEKNYDGVIRNRQKPSDPATIKAEWSTGEESQGTVTGNGVATPLDAKVDVSSFRLDQQLMDRLVGVSPYARAQIFMQAFFPEAVESLALYEQASAAHQQALAKLARIVERLLTARKVLSDLETWQSAPTIRSAENFPELLNRWLEQTAFLDLVRRTRSVHETVKNAQARGWQPAHTATIAIDSLGAGLNDGEFARIEADAARLVNELQTHLSSFTASSTTDAPAPGVVRPITQLEVDALDAVSVFLFDPDILKQHGLFGQKLRAVVHAGDAATYGNVIIGDGRWADLILKAIDACVAACQALTTDQSVATPWPVPTLSPEFESAKKTYDARASAGQSLTKAFIDKLRIDANGGEFDGSLVAALNELLALFTPARWAYPEITLPPAFDAGRVGLSMHFAGAGSDARVELHFNTAELNLLTVALFLLCVGRVRKPLNLLVLDDPLQNMDELTTTALARGITKVVRLWEQLKRPESLLFLFHGEDDLERFNAEVSAAVYRLPWLSPSGLSSENEIKSESATHDLLAVQRIEALELYERQPNRTPSLPTPE